MQPDIVNEPLTHPRIPYGAADFRRIRLNRWLYVEKALRRLEQGCYAFLIRPRRFGKWGHEFDAVFAGTDIGQNPPADRHRYVVLRFNFSMMNDALDTLKREFDTYSGPFPDVAVRRLLASDSAPGKLNELLLYTKRHGIPLYLLIDEDDNFANTVLAYHGAQAYHRSPTVAASIAIFSPVPIASAGALNACSSPSVSPMTMDAMTSGFDIGKNISLESEFNEMVGFTEAEVRRLSETCRDHGVFDQDVEAAARATATMAEASSTTGSALTACLMRQLLGAGA